MSSSPARTIYLAGAADPVWAMLHPGNDARLRDTAVVLCPPFGWEEVCSYRPRREWAQLLASAGYPALRIALPGSADSGGHPRDDDRLQAWTDAVKSSALWLRTVTGSERVAVIGIGLGGFVAYQAASLGAEIDDLVLWATPSRGRALVRQLRAFSKLELAQCFEGLEPPPPPATPELEAGGFLMSARTVHELERIDLTTLALPQRRSCRVLLLGRDSIDPDVRLRERLAGAGVPVAVQSGEGFGAMTFHPQRAETPSDAIERVTEWLGTAAAAASGGGKLLAAGSTLAGAHVAGRIGPAPSSQVTETPLTIEQEFGRIEGILTEPAGTDKAGLCAVLLNAGAIYRIGPNRMWVEAARRWARLGVVTLRLDIEGIGEADGDGGPYAEDAGLYVPRLVPQVVAALDVLQRRGVADRFVLGGLCSGAYWAFHAALEDPRVTAAFMLNPRALVWDPSVSEASDLRRLRTHRVSWETIRRNASIPRAAALGRWLLGARSRRMAVDDALERMRATGKRVLLVFSEDEPLHTDLVLSGRLDRLERWPSFTIEHIRVRDHTLRPISSQLQAAEALDRALAVELAVESASDQAGSAITASPRSQRRSIRRRPRSGANR
jgi:pimeloyl-ACP methyl ester carboxylesterase/alpha/beta superfamily hydrolase